MQNPIDSYECQVCCKCYNGTAEIEFGPFFPEYKGRKCVQFYDWCDHKHDAMISRRVYERHMQILTDGMINAPQSTAEGHNNRDTGVYVQS